MKNFKTPERNIAKSGYLFIYVSSPEACNCSIICIRGKDGRASGPSFIYVFNYDQRLTDGYAMVDENWDSGIHRIGLKKEVTLGV